MDKITYLAELAEGLARWVPERERQDILRYYAEYFEEAGPDREGEVVAELGDPWALSSRLAVEGGFVTREGAESWTPPRRKRKIWPVVAAVSAALVIIVAVSVAMAAARFGGFIGRLVAGYGAGENVAQVAEEYVAPGSWDSVTYVEGDGVYVSQEDGSLDAFDEIDVDIGLGNVLVQTGDDYALYVEQRADMDYELKWEVSDGKLKVEDKGSGKDLHNLSGIEVTIYVPDGTELEKAEVSTGMGDVYIAGLYARRLTAASGLGDVQCFDARVMEKLELDSGTGNVVLNTEELYSGAELKLHSGTGQVEASLYCMERDCAYKAETGLGNVTVNGGNRGSSVTVKGGDRPYRLEAASGLGDVNIFFNAD